MAWKHISTSREGGVVTCTISNPPTHTLTATGVLELHQLLDELEQDPALRVLVLTGAGEDVFIAHYEVGELADTAEQLVGSRSPSGEAPDQQLHPLHRLCLRLEALGAPSVAALNGHAAGGGFELALACDFRLAAEGPYRFGLPETGVGIIPGAGGTQRMARMIGTARALDLILHGTLLPSEEMQALGLIHRRFPKAGFADEVATFARVLAGRAPIALAAAKQAIRAGMETTLEEGLAVEQRAFGRAMATKDAAGAMRAMLKGESWEWLGE